MKLSIGELHFMLFGNSEFHKNPLCKSHTLLKVLKYFLPIISRFLD
jgi:hypothetical protein